MGIGRDIPSSRLLLSRNTACAATRGALLVHSPVSTACATEKSISPFSFAITRGTLYPYFLEATTRGAYFRWLRFRLFHMFPFLPVIPTYMSTGVASFPVHGSGQAEQVSPQRFPEWGRTSLGEVSTKTGEEAQRCEPSWWTPCSRENDRHKGLAVLLPCSTGRGSLARHRLPCNHLRLHYNGIHKLDRCVREKSCIEGRGNKERRASRHIVHSRR